MTKYPPDSSEALANIDIPEIITWAYEAGQIALAYFNKVNPRLKQDNSFLTEADVAIESFLAERLQATYPDHDLIGEEGLQVQQEQQPDVYIWAIDPLDGTTTFVKGLPGWGISIGLLYRGQPCFGLFYMPLLDDLTYASTKAGIAANKSGVRLDVQSNWQEKGFLAINASAHAQYRIHIRRTRTLGGVGASLIYTARGAATAAFLPRTRLWDLVAGSVILAEAGGELRYLSGKALDYLALLDGQLAPEPILAAHPALLTDLQKAIQPQQPSYTSPSHGNPEDSYTSGVIPGKDLAIH